MKKIVSSLIFVALVICGCERSSVNTEVQNRLIQVEKDVAALRTQESQDAANLAARIDRLATNQPENLKSEAAVKLWTLDKLEDLELRETTNRYELRTNLEALMIKIGEITAGSK